MAATTFEDTAFMKQLVSSDRYSRDKAVSSLCSYLTSGRQFTELDLSKLWKGLFFCMWHSDRPLTQQKLAFSLSELLTPLDESMFLPFLSAFWATLVANYGLIDSFRLDKFLSLIRSYVRAAFAYIAARSWSSTLAFDYLRLIGSMLLEDQGKVSDGLRYHILDVWVDELDKTDVDRTAPVSSLLEIILSTSVAGRTKVLRAKAAAVLEDPRLSTWTQAVDD